ncbi:MAG: hypothetical protein J1E58_01520 [Prevotella sp.]|nr:hypothetical protein [Prevotella sp.]
MIITPVGAILLLSIGGIFLYKKNIFANLFMLCLITEVFVRMGYVAAIGNTTITYEGVVQYILIAYCLLNLPRWSKAIRKWWVLLAVSYIIPMVLLILFPSNALVSTFDVTWDEILFEGASLVYPTVTGFVVKNSLKFIAYSFVIIYIYQKWKLSDYQQMMAKFLDISKVFLCLGYVEFVAKNMFGLNETWGNLLILLFGEKESTAYEGRLRGNTFELNLFTQEASHYAYVLMFVALLSLAYNVFINKERKIGGIVIGSLLLMVLTTSFSSVYLSVTFIIYYLLYRWYILKPKSEKIEKIVLGSIICLGSVSITAILSIYSDGFVVGRLLNLIDNFEDFFTVNVTYGSQYGDGSSQVRLISMIQTIMVFFQRPIFGYSLYSIYAHSPTAMYLAGVGVFGMLCWIKFFFYVSPLYKQFSLVKKPYALAIALLLFMNLLGGDRHTFSGVMLAMNGVAYIFLYADKKLLNENSPC